MRDDGAVLARVIVLAGPSGSGKSRLAERIGLPVLRLDDFYKSGGDPTLPRIASGANAGIVDWDHPDSWLPDDALDVLRELCETGHAEVPIYEIAQDGRCGWQTLDLGGSPLFVAEGIFAHDIVAPARDLGLVAEALCIRRSPLTTFWLRLGRDLREHRKPPVVLVRRGLALMRAQRGVVADAVAQGCRPISPDDAVALVATLR